MELAKKALKVPAKGKYKTAHAVLKAAYSIIRQPGRWIQNGFAMDCKGRQVARRSPQAVAFCALGAVRFINGPKEKIAEELLAQEAARMRGDWVKGASNSGIIMINDQDDPEQARKEVHRMFRRAIRRAKEERL